MKDGSDAGPATKRGSAASLLFFLALTLVDIVAVECYYRPMGAWNEIWLWHHIYFILWISLPLLLCVRLRRIIPASVIVAFLFGIEDTMFYLLQLRFPSPVYPGVAILGIWEPTFQTGLAVNLLGLVMIWMVMRIDAYGATHLPFCPGNASKHIRELWEA